MGDLSWEFLATIAAIVLALTAPNIGTGLVRGIVRPFRRLAMRPKAAIVVVALTNLAISVSLAIWVGLPKLSVHDEFAYALTADTFAHGRLTNPTHPMWKHFESYHIFHTPSYQSKYPPAQGLVMALGQIVTGYQIAGVWLSLAVACGAVCWMLQAWTRPRWALLGGLIIAIHPGIVHQWGETYWGGGIAMLGGALMFGALPRVTKTACIRDAVVLGVGVVLLANSRPYEGVVVSIPVAIHLLIWFIRKHEESVQTRMKSVALPIIAILTISSGWMSYYNYRVTGSPLNMPYRHWMRLYSTGTSMSELLLRVDDGRKASRPDFEAASLADGVTVDDLVPFWRQSGINSNDRLVKLVRYCVFYWRSPLWCVLLTLPAVLLTRRLGFATLCYTAVWLAVMVNACSGWSHYYAPGAAFFGLIVVEGLRRVRVWKIRSRPSGRLLVTAIPLILLLASIRQFSTMDRNFIPSRVSWIHARSVIEDGLEEMGGGHIVLVRYSAGHSTSAEWVYNRADLDASPVLFARPGTPEETIRLAEYFNDRSIWCVNGDHAHPRRPRLTKWERPDRQNELPKSREVPNSEGGNQQVTSLDTEGIHSVTRQVAP